MVGSGQTGVSPVDQWEALIEHLWGVRYVDDLVRTRTNSNWSTEGTPGGEDPPTPGDFTDTADSRLYALTDQQFSVIALVSNTGRLIERVEYSPYGEARHRPRHDITGDGAVSADDRTKALAANNKRIYQSGYDPDADVNRDGIINSNDTIEFGTSSYCSALMPGLVSAMSTTAGSVNGQTYNTIGYCGYVFNAEIWAGIALATGPSSAGCGGLYTVRYRHYDPSNGRWLERDMLGYVDGSSLYEYVRGMAEDSMDPSGLSGLITGLFLDDYQDLDMWNQSSKTAQENLREIIRRQLREGKITCEEARKRLAYLDENRRIQREAMFYNNAARFMDGAANSIVVAFGVVVLVAIAPILAPVVAALGIIGTVSFIINAQNMSEGDWWAAAGDAVGGIIGGRLGNSIVCGPFGGGGCFVAGTLVLTATGAVEIESIQPGDQVWAYDHQSQNWQLCDVEECFVRDYEGDIITLEFVLDDGSTETVRATGNHPFWVVDGEALTARPPSEENNSGPDSNPRAGESPNANGSRWVDARWLRLGDRFLTRSGYSATVSGLTIRLERVRVYNLKVRGLHQYSVGATGVLVHNAPCPPQKPNPAKWRDKGGKIENHPDGSVTYTDAQGNSVTYNSKGYANFTPYEHPDGGNVQIQQTGNHYVDNDAADVARGKPKPDDWTWHHNEDGTTMQLVPRGIHQRFHHSGGASIVKNR